jgi:hypothetical protein
MLVRSSLFENHSRFLFRTTSWLIMLQCVLLTTVTAAAILLMEEQDQNNLEELLTDAEVTNLCKVVRHPGGTIVAAAILLMEEQDQNNLEELLTDAEVTNLCKVVRHPGGTIPGPASAGGGVAAQVNNPGISVSENYLKLACFYLKHRYRVLRVVLPAEITLVNVRALIGLRLSEENHKDPKDKPKIANKDWPKTMEAIEEYLRAYHGETGIPLAYVIRHLVAVSLFGIWIFQQWNTTCSARCRWLNDVLVSEIPKFLSWQPQTGSHSHSQSTRSRDAGPILDPTVA